MKVSHLIEALLRLPQDHSVWVVYDGAARQPVEHAWPTSDGRVLLAGSERAVYYSADRPIGAPTQEEDPYWQTPSNGDEDGSDDCDA